jgi:ABC-type glycerol-3-phosphate transport system substrate-binding protein
VNIRKFMALALAAVLAVACQANASPSSSAAQSAAATPGTSAAATPGASASAAPLAADPAEAVIQNVEPNAEISFWTFYLSPTFDNYIKSTIARFQATYPDVKVNWSDHQGTFRQELDNAYAAHSAPEVINL